ncbi:MAG: DUF86 domain-containing protein [Deltaproteobacteria bacterium]|nr:DUF86 domain-containing protein [Deltaproteobacteria bacterium]
MRHDSVYLLDILLMAKDAAGFVSGIDRNGFMSDRKCQLAVIRCLEVMGEAAKRVTSETRERLKDVPWSKMTKMRDLLIHAYSRVDLVEIWDTVINDLPPLIAILEKVVPPEDKR